MFFKVYYHVLSLFLPVLHIMDESGCMGFCTVEDIAAEGGAEHGRLLHVPMIEQEVANISRSDPFSLAFY